MNLFFTYISVCKWTTIVSSILCWSLLNSIYNNKTSELLTCFKLEKKLNVELEYPILV